jgi:hypothetical protein
MAPAQGSAFNRMRRRARIAARVSPNATTRSTLKSGGPRVNSIPGSRSRPAWTRPASKLFKPMVDKADFSLAEIDRLANEAEASVLATGSRFAAFTGTPCVFVFAENGKVRYCSRSTTLRAANAWIPPRMELPEGSLARRVRGGAANDGAEEVEADIWFEDWTRGGALMEDARHVAKYDQTIALLWFEDDNVPPPRDGRREREVDEFGLAELDGVLPWLGRKNRRR